MSNSSILTRAAALAAILVIPAVSACADLTSDGVRVARVNENPYVTTSTTDASYGTKHTKSNEPDWLSPQFYGP